MRRTLLALCLLLFFVGSAPAQEVKIPPCPAICPCPCSAGLPCTCGHPVVHVSGVRAKTATLLVSLPADATLTMNGKVMKTFGASRKFRTPARPCNAAFYCKKAPPRARKRGWLQ